MFPAALIVALVVGPAALAHVTGGNRHNWGSHPYEEVAPDYDPIGSSNYGSANTGGHNVYVNKTDGTDCPGIGNQFNIRSVHEIPLAPDEISVPVTFTCGLAQNYVYSWPSDTGEFHLDIGKLAGSCSSCVWTAKGHIHYP